MFRNSIIFSMICVILICGISVYVSLMMPEMDQYPLHWNAQGEPDRFGTRKEAIITLAVFPVISIVTALLLWLVPKIDPLRENLIASQKAYTVVWMLVMALMVVITAVIALSYLSPNGVSSSAAPRTIVIVLSVFFMAIGNVLGKVRRNFMFGIRTPWTLSSELAWEKTHRVGAWMFVLAGVISLLMAIVKPVWAIYTFGALTTGMVMILFVYSYVCWKNDPEKIK